MDNLFETAEISMSSVQTGHSLAAGKTSSITVKVTKVARLSNPHRALRADSTKPFESPMNRS